MGTSNTFGGCQFLDCAKLSLKPGFTPPAHSSSSALAARTIFLHQFLNMSLKPGLFFLIHYNKKTLTVI
jgi:hypothetical protein